MDLLEIRKKAKGMKDAATEDASGAGGTGPDGQAATAGKAKAARGKKPRGKKNAPKNAVSEAPVAIVEAEAGPAQPARAETGPVEEAAVPDAPTEATEAPHDGEGAGTGEPPDAATEEPSGFSGPDAGLEDEVEYLAFMLAGEEYAVRVDDVKEIIRPQKTTLVPRTPGFVVGITSLRGVILPVFDMKKRLGFEETGRTKTARVIIVSDGGSPLGILVDRVTGVARLKMGEIEPPPAVIGGVESEYLHGVGRQGDRLLILMNTQRVLEMEGR